MCEYLQGSSDQVMFEFLLDAFPRVEIVENLLLAIQGVLEDLINLFRRLAPQILYRYFQGLSETS